jgi:hypothetical protein
MMGDTAVDMRYDIPGQLAIGNTYKIFDFKNSKVEIHNVTTTSSGGKNPTYTIYEDNKNLSFKNYNAGLYIETAVSQKELDKQLDVAQTFYQNRKPNSP